MYVHYALSRTQEVQEATKAQAAEANAGQAALEVSMFLMSVMYVP